MIFSPSAKKRRAQLRLSERRYLLLLLDSVAIVAAIIVALRIWALNAKSPFDALFIWERVYWFPVLLGLWLLLATANDFYELRIASNRRAMWQGLVLITVQMWVAYLVVFFLSESPLPRLFILYFGLAAPALVAFSRLLQPLILGWASQKRRVLIVGANESAATLIATIQQDADHAFEILGVIAETEDSALTTLAGIPVVGTGAALRVLTAELQASELILTTPNQMSRATFQGVMDAYEGGVSLVPMPLVYERITGRVPVEHISDNWAVVLPTETGAYFNPYRLLKRLMDVGAALVVMAVFGLLLPILALLIRLDSAGSIFYSQERTGLHGRSFRIYKLRSMVSNAEAQSGAVFSQQGDKRVTRIGRFMRKTRLDELPQAWNILRGDMSLIGPRPERPEHVERLTQKIPFYRTRLTVQPGLTGWAQVRYGYGANDDDALIKLQYDLYYIRHQSLGLDLNIMLRTVGKVLKMSGM